MRVPDKYPAYISWTTFEQIQAMLHDNHAEYDRNNNTFAKMCNVVGLLS